MEEQRKTHGKRDLTILFVVLIGLIVGVQVLSHHGSQDAANADSRVGSGLLATTSAGSAIHTWAVDGGSSYVATLQADLASVTTASQSGDSAAAAGACYAMQQDVMKAQGHDPIPDPAAQQAWSAGLAAYYKATGDCYAGASATDASLIEKATGEFSAGNASFGLAAAAVRAAGG